MTVYNFHEPFCIGQRTYVQCEPACLHIFDKGADGAESTIALLDTWSVEQLADYLIALRAAMSEAKRG